MAHPHNSPIKQGLFSPFIDRQPLVVADSVDSGARLLLCAAHWGRGWPWVKDFTFHHIRVFI